MAERGHARILVLGAGPAAVAAAILLDRLGHDIRVLGRARARSAMEGVSERAIDGLGRLGCGRALAVLDRYYDRISCWNARSVRVNRECVVDRERLDSALIADLTAARIPMRSAQVGAVRRGTGGVWLVDWRDGGAAGTETADFIVEARGGAAPRRAPDADRGPRALALSRRFSGCRPGAPITVAESFPDGWAWCALAGDGGAVVQVVVDEGALPAAAKRELDGFHRRCLGALPLIGDTLAVGAPAEEAVQVRAIWPRLRAERIGPGWLRVGDAAASCDPLSGHGIFEALSGAFAAAPVINTMLRAPERTALASEHYASRIEARFRANLGRAAELYRAETRWPEREFWRRRALPNGRAGAAEPPSVVSASVAEDGFIVSRQVVRCAEHPQGIRFLGAVELAPLHRLLESGGGDLGALAGELKAPPGEVAHAWRWLHRRNLAPPPRCA